MGESLLTEVVGVIAAIVVASLTGGVAYLKRQLDGIDKHVNHKEQHGRTESLYDLAHKNDLVQEQMFELVKSVKDNVESQGDGLLRLARTVDLNNKDLQQFKAEVSSRLEKLENSK